EPPLTLDLTYAAIKFHGRCRPRFKARLASTPYFVHEKVRAVALGGLVFGCHFSHGIIRGRATNLRVRFDAVPVDHQNHAARVLDAGKKFDAVGAGIVGLRKNLTEDLDVFVAFLRLDMLYDDFVNHGCSFLSRLTLTLRE